MTLRPAILALALSMSLSGCIINVNAANAQPKTHSHQQLTLDTQAIEQLVIQAGAGELVIVGVEGQTAIILEADIYSYQGVDYTLTLEQQSNKAMLKAEFDSSNNFNRSPYIDLHLSVPKHLLLQIDDGSGRIDISNVDANMDITDGSGDIQIAGGQAIKINDGSGGIHITHSQGKMSIDDGSGEIFVEHVKGDIDIQDGSGDMSIAHIDGKVTVTDGSGGISIRHALGLTLNETGSGDVSFEDIQGPVSMH